MLHTLYIVNNIILWYFIIVCFIYIVLLFGSLSDIFFRFRENFYGDMIQVFDKRFSPPVAVIIPVYNERDNVFNTVESVFNSTYPNFQIILVNDGSTDDTLQILIEKYDLKKTYYLSENIINTLPVKQYYISKKDPRLIVIDKTHGGGIGDNFNVGLNATTCPYFITLDADGIIDPKAIETDIFTLLSRPNTIVVGGGVYLLNGCEIHDGKITKVRMPRSLVAAFQVGEYLRAFLFGRSGWNMFRGALCYSGTHTLFEKAPVMAAGGYVTNNRSQDVEITVHLHALARENKTPCRLIFTPASFVWTDAPATLRAFWKQRVFWQMGTMQSFFQHFYMFFNPRYGITGLFTYPFYIFVEIFGCIVEFIAYLTIPLSWYLHDFNLVLAVLIFLVSLGFISFLTMSVVFINFITFNKYSLIKDGLYLLFLSIFEVIGFRQFMIVSRVYGTFKYIYRVIFKRHKKYADV